MTIPFKSGKYRDCTDTFLKDIFANFYISEENGLFSGREPNAGEHIY